MLFCRLKAFPLRNKTPRYLQETTDHRIQSRYPVEQLPNLTYGSLTVVLDHAVTVNKEVNTLQIAAEKTMKVNEETMPDPPSLKSVKQHGASDLCFRIEMTAPGLWQRLTGAVLSLPRTRVWMHVTTESHPNEPSPVQVLPRERGDLSYGTERFVSTGLCLGKPRRGSPIRGGGSGSLS